MEANLKFDYRPLYILLALLSLVALLNTPILTTLWRHSFDDGTYSHAYLIPLISGYLFYDGCRRGELELRNHFSKIALAMLLFSCLCMIITVRAQISIGYWLSFIMILTSASLMVFKARLAVIFPTVYLIFLLPLWGSLTGGLQDMSVAAASFLLQFTDIPFFVQDQFISLPAGNFEVANGCSGLRYLLVSLAISSLYVFLYIRNYRSAAIFIGFAIIGALVTNWIRIVSLILIGQYTNMESELMTDHNNFGWYLYVPFMIILFYLGNKLADQNEATQPAVVATGKVNKIAILSTLILLLISSSYLLLANRTEVLSSEEYPATPSADIKFYSSFSEQPLNGFETSGIEQTYRFYCRDLDCKPSYYDNEILPAGWQVLQFRDHKKYAEYILQKGRKQAHLQLWYQREDFQTSNVRSFKLMRIKSLLSSAKADQLTWQFRYCDMECEPLLVKDN
ncbi:exosortase [Thalassotalea litorea]|uniref:Exosortase n=1 Tax=Thalassotalea litorea TaxID=2020715 RepID=A0A5R9IJP7_9GAMM|nr:exosortase [Thalassotalea litorea]TLU65780.1 exosortase [Thalassotalea litorea]